MAGKKRGRDSPCALSGLLHLTFLKRMRRIPLSIGRAERLWRRRIPDLVGRFGREIKSQFMKVRTHHRSEFSALLPVVALLAVATLAKLGAVTQFFHLAH